MGQEQSKAKPVIELRGDNPVYNTEVLREMIRNGPAKGNTKVLVLCISGVYRSGKTFLFSMFKTYLDHYSEHKSDDGWLKNGGIKINGGNWAQGQDTVTLGIWMYMYPKLLDNRAIILMDCQGNQDPMRSTPTLDNLIPFLALQLADVHILNVDSTLGTDDLDRFGLGIYHAYDESIGSIFEKQIFFLIRNWENAEKPRQLDQMIAGTTSLAVKESAMRILHTFRAVEVAALPFPGNGVIGKSEANGVTLGDTSEQFRRGAGEFFNKLVQTAPSDAQKNSQELLDHFELMAAARVEGEVSTPQQEYEQYLLGSAYKECYTYFIEEVEKTMKSQLSAVEIEAEVTAKYLETLTRFKSHKQVRSCGILATKDDYLGYLEIAYRYTISYVRQEFEEDRLNVEVGLTQKDEQGLKPIKCEDERLKQEVEELQIVAEKSIVDEKTGLREAIGCDEQAYLDSSAMVEEPAKMAQRINDLSSAETELKVISAVQLRMERSEMINPEDLEIPKASDVEHNPLAEAVKEVQTLSADDMESLIIDLLDSNDIPSYQVLHNPDKTNEIKVIGKGVEKLNAKLSQVADNNNYTIVTKDVEFGSVNDGKPSIANWIKLCGGIRTTGTCTLKIPGTHISVIDAIMQGKDENRRRRQIGLFGMTTAHTFLTEEQIEKLRKSTEHFTHVNHEVIVQAYEETFYMSVNEGADIDINGSPRFLYKYWKPKHVFCEWEVLQDIAFFKLENCERECDDLVFSTNDDVAQEERQPSAIEEAYIVNVLSQDALRELDGSRILCAGKPGKLIREPRICEFGFTIGTHLAFILDGGEDEWLKVGDSGSLLCLEEKHNGEVPILGMFIGQLQSDNRIHQAVILSWNIQQVEATPRLKISDIKLAETSTDFEDSNSNNQEFYN